MPLNPKQEAFVREYLVDLNATQAAIRAGYSEHTAKAQGSRLLTNAAVGAAIAKAQARRANRLEITQDMVLQELAHVGFARITDLVTWDEGRTVFVPSDELEDGQVAAVASIEAETRTFTREDGDGEMVHKVKLKLNDKLSALEKIGRHLGMFQDKPEPPPDPETTVRTVREALREIIAADGLSDAA